MRSDYIIVVGCGRLGSILASRLSGIGHRVVVIDRREAAFDKLTNEFSGFQIVGDASEMAVLRAAKIAQADYLFATTTEDNLNLMVAQIAGSIFNVPHVIARVYDPTRESIYRRLNVEMISPTQLSVAAFLYAVDPSLEHKPL
ncbi:MAG: TrkA family potassium uptake protein [Anaerolineae bacterium]|nr:TrkA family potassium uptake protein [Anaerolineae bacterium]